MRSAITVLEFAVGGSFLLGLASYVALGLGVMAGFA
jgi:hypothetical protein